MAPEGTLVLTFDEFNLNKVGYIFLIDAGGYHFSARVLGRKVLMRRQDTEVTLPIHDEVRHPQWITLFLGWSPRQLQVGYGIIPSLAGRVDAESSVDTPYSIVPPQTLRWLRKQNLIETVIYDTEIDFRDKIHSILKTLQQSIDTMLSEKGFWDVVYDSGKIVSRRPKREQDLHSLLHGLLLDQFLMSSIEVVPEYSMGAGRLDFMLIGNVKAMGPSRLCLEVKHAHSADVLRGLVEQLPMYMENAKAANGVYLVLWFGQNPNPNGIQNYADLQTRLVNAQVLHHGSALSKRIRVLSLDLTQSPKASGT